MYFIVDGIGRKLCCLIWGDGFFYMNEINFEYNIKWSCVLGIILFKCRIILGLIEIMEKEGFYEEWCKFKYMVGYYLVFYYVIEGLFLW